jgi:hypothetical protein
VCIGSKVCRRIYIYHKRIRRGSEEDQKRIRRGSGTARPSQGVCNKRAGRFVGHNQSLRRGLGGFRGGSWEVLRQFCARKPTHGGRVIQELEPFGTLSSGSLVSPHIWGGGAPHIYSGGLNQKRIRRGSEEDQKRIRRGSGTAGAPHRVRARAAGRGRAGAGIPTGGKARCLFAWVKLLNLYT